MTNESNYLELPAWVRKSDGRVVAFDGDEICQTIFAGTEALRQPNAFLAREMTESVLHFLAQELGADSARPHSNIPATDQIADLVVKVLRELGQSALAQAVMEKEDDNIRATTVRELPSGARPLPYGRGSETPSSYAAECLRQFSLNAVFSRDLASAQEEGFLSLAGLEHPAELEGGVPDWPGLEQGPLLPAILRARRRFGSFLVLDGPEHTLQSQRQLRALVDDLEHGLEATGLSAIVNLNAAEPPFWAQPMGASPLFQAEDETQAGGGSSAVSLLEALLQRFSTFGKLNTGGSSPGEMSVRVDWHLSERDFQTEFRHDLHRALRHALVTGQVSFVLDRPGPLASSGPALAEGIDRRHPATLQVVALHLTRLVNEEGIAGNAEVFLQKLLHLARMAVSAGTQKRQFLRGLIERGDDSGDLRRGFFLDRARLTVIPVGLAAIVQTLTGQGIAGKQGLILARQIVERLGQCLHEAGRAVNLETLLDSPWWQKRGEGERGRRGEKERLSPPLPFSPSPLPSPPLASVSPNLAGLTCADFSASAEDQVRAAGALHQLTGTGTATLLLSPDLAGDTGRLAQLLQLAWKKTNLIRIRLARIPGPVEQPQDLLMSLR